MAVARIAVILCCLVASQVAVATDYSVRSMLPCQSISTRTLALDMRTMRVLAVRCCKHIHIQSDHVKAVR